MLELEDVRSGYGKLEILQSASLRVPDGAIVGIIGPNGAGKSTLLKTAFGYLAPWAGRIALDGREIAGRRPDEIMRCGVGYLAQAGGLFAEMTVHDNLVLGGYTVSRADKRRAIDSVYARFPLFHERRRQLAGALSGGEQRLLAIARALIVRPRLLLLDEPSAALAPRFIDQVYATLVALNRDGLAMLIVEQNVEAILAVAHRVFVLDLGRNAFDGTPAELRGSDRIRRLYLGEEERGLMLESLLEFLIQGLVLGGLYALFAVGLSLIFGVLDVINVAHGEFFAVGGYLAFAAVVLLHLPGALGVLGAAVGTFLLGLCVYPLLIAPLKRRLGGRPQGPLYLVLTLGLSTFLQSSLLAIAGGDYLRVPPQVSGILDLGVTAVSHQRLLVLGAAAVLLTALFAFLRFHPEGLAVRAVALNPDAAQAMGINLPRIFALTLALGVALAGVGGALMAPLFNVYPAVGFPLTIKAFAITILGGMGNPAGALVASFLVSIAESLSVMVIPSQWQNLIAFAVMIVMLLVRPRGLFGRAVSR